MEATFISLKNTFHFGGTHSFFISERPFDATTYTDVLCALCVGVGSVTALVLDGTLSVFSRCKSAMLVYTLKYIL
jgi:hypothetical protein